MISAKPPVNTSAAASVTAIWNFTARSVSARVELVIVAGRAVGFGHRVVWRAKFGDDLVAGHAGRIVAGVDWCWARRFHVDRAGGHPSGEQQHRANGPKRFHESPVWPSGLSQSLAFAPSAC